MPVLVESHSQSGAALPPENTVRSVALTQCNEFVLSLLPLTICPPQQIETVLTRQNPRVFVLVYYHIIELETNKTELPLLA